MAAGKPAHEGPTPEPAADPTRRLAALAIAGAWLLPRRVAAHGPILCPVRRATGLPCPACGLTRSWQAALHGRPGESLRLHPFGILALGGAAAYAAGLDRRLAPETRERLRGTWSVAVVGWTAAWLLRLVTAVRDRRRTGA